MKNLCKIAGLSSLMLVALALSSFAQWGYGPVVVFDGKNGGGTASSFGVGEFRNGSGEFGTLRNDSARSVTVPTGYRVRFCENEGSRGEGSGRCEEVTEGNHNLQYGGTASYIRVFGPRSGGNWGSGWNGGGQRGVVLYEDANSTGRSQEFGVGRYLNMTGALGNVRNDKASSVVVQRGFRVRLCEDEGNMGIGAGRCEEYGEGRRAYQTAYAALKHTHEKVGDHWEPKESNGPSDPQAEGGRDTDRKTAGGVDANASKKHLEDVARRLEIRGRSRMTKEQLVQAIQKANDRSTARARSSD